MCRNNPSIMISYPTLTIWVLKTTYCPRTQTKQGWMRQLCRICNFLNHFCILVFMCCRPFQLIFPFTALSLFICSLFLALDVLFVLFILSLLVYLCLSIILYLFVLLLIFLSVFNSSDVMSSSYRPLLIVIFYLHINISGIYPILFLSLFFSVILPVLLFSSFYLHWFILSFCVFTFSALPFCF